MSRCHDEARLAGASAMMRSMKRCAPSCMPKDQSTPGGRGAVWSRDCAGSRRVFIQTPKAAQQILRRQELIHEIWLGSGEVLVRRKFMG